MQPAGSTNLEDSNRVTSAFGATAFNDRGEFGDISMISHESGEAPFLQTDAGESFMEEMKPVQPQPHVSSMG